jgi:hypothetical protein
VDFAVACTATGSPPPPPAPPPSPPPSGTIARWTQLDKITSDGFQDIWGSAANDIFVVGYNKLRLSGIIAHFDGSAWAIGLKQPDVGFQAVWGAAPNDVYAVGSHNAVAAGAIIHFDGSGWSEESNPNPAQPGDTTVQFRSVFGLSSSDVLAVGAAYGAGPTAIAEHYDGHQWLALSLPSTANRELLDVWQSSDHDVYLVGDIQNTPSGRDEGVIDHFDGSSWTETLYGDDIHLKAVWGTSSSDVFTVGDDGIVLHFDGSQWTRQHTPITKAVHEIWGSSPTDVIAVAARGIVLHYDGSAWSQMTSPTDRDLFGVWGSAADNVYAVGLLGVILHGTS